jgi:hypothetical protein
MGLLVDQAVVVVEVVEAVQILAVEAVVLEEAQLLLEALA